MNPIKMSATQAKLQFGFVMDKAKEGIPVLIEKNSNPQCVVISLDDYEDYLELQDEKFQQDIEEQHKQIKGGNFGDLDGLYSIHQDTIRKEAQK